MYSPFEIQLSKVKGDYLSRKFTAIRQKMAHASLHELKQSLEALKGWNHEKALFKKELDEMDSVNDAQKKLNVHISWVAENTAQVQFNLYTDCKSPYFKKLLPAYCQDSINQVTETTVPEMEKLCHVYSISFSLQRSPHLLLCLFSVLSVYFSEIEHYKLNTIAISGECQGDRSGEKIFSQLIQKIHFFISSKNEICEHTINLLHDIQQQDASAFFYHYQLHDLAIQDNAQSNRYRRIQNLCALSRELIHSGQKNDLNNYFSWMDFYVKRALFFSCQNQFLLDEQHLTSIQWNFLKFSDFKYVHDEICIDNIDNNPTYNIFYAEKKILHAEYESHIISLVKALDLDFKPESDLRSRIVFTSQSTRKLLSLGFCLKDECQKEMYMQNTWKLFSSRKHSQTEERIAPFFCPKTVIEEIFGKVHDAPRLL